MVTENGGTEPDVTENGDREPGRDADQQFDQEIRRRAVLATGFGILLVTVLSMALMGWLSEYLASERTEGQPLTEVQHQRLLQTEAENRLREQTETRVFPQLGWPEDVSHPGEMEMPSPYPPDPPVPKTPVVQVAPRFDLQRFLREQEEIQGALGWDDPSKDEVHIPLEQAIGKVVAEHLPHVAPEEPQPGTHPGDLPAAVEPIETAALSGGAPER